MKCLSATVSALLVADVIYYYAALKLQFTERQEEVLEVRGNKHLLPGLIQSLCQSDEARHLGSITTWIAAFGLFRPIGDLPP